MAGAREPLNALTPDDYGPLIVVVGYSLASISIVAAIMRFWHSAYRKIKFGMDDLTFLIGNIFAILSSIILHLAVKYGLGRHISTLADHTINNFFKTMLAVHCLGLVAMFFAKVSVLLLFDRIFVSLPLKLMLLAALTAWLLFSLIINLICRFAPPWTFTQSQCPTHGALLYPQIVINALTDLALGICIIPSAWKLKMPWKDKSLVMAVFGSRILVCVPAIVQLALLHRYLTSDDLTWASFDSAIIDQSTIYLSIICATIPRMNPLLSALPSGRTSVRFPDSDFRRIRKAMHFSKSASSKSSS